MLDEATTCSSNSACSRSCLSKYIVDATINIVTRGVLKRHECVPNLLHPSTPRQTVVQYRGVTKSRARGGGSGASGWRSVCGRGQRTPSTHSSLTIIINTGVFRYYIILLHRVGLFSSSLLVFPLLLIHIMIDDGIYIVKKLYLYITHTYYYSNGTELLLYVGCVYL